MYAWHDAAAMTDWQDTNSLPFPMSMFHKDPSELNEAEINSYHWQVFSSETNAPFIFWWHRIK